VASCFHYGVHLLDGLYVHFGCTFAGVEGGDTELLDVLYCVVQEDCARVANEDWNEFDPTAVTQGCDE